MSETCGAIGRKLVIAGSAGASLLAGKAGVAFGAKDASEIDPDHLGARLPGP
jgi:hypothetical protein